MNKSTVGNSTGEAATPPATETTKVVEQAKSAATHIASDAADRALGAINTQFDARKDKAMDTMGSVASALRDTGNKLKGVGPLGDVAGQAADGVESVVDFFEGKHVGDVVRDVERFARREPALFLGAAVALGLIGGRFLKSSARRNDVDDARRDGIQRRHDGGSGGYPERRWNDDFGDRPRAMAYSPSADRPPKRMSAERPRPPTPPLPQRSQGASTASAGTTTAPLPAVQTQAGSTAPSTTKNGPGGGGLGSA